MKDASKLVSLNHDLILVLYTIIAVSCPIMVIIVVLCASVGSQFVIEVLYCVIDRTSFSSVMTVTEATTFIACGLPCRSHLRVSGPVTSASNSSTLNEGSVTVALLVRLCRHQALLCEEDQCVALNQA